MKVLKLSVKSLSLLGIYSENSESINFFKKIRFYIFLTIFIGLFCGGSFVFIVRNYNELEKILSAILIFSGGFAALGSLISFGCDKNQMN